MLNDNRDCIRFTFSPLRGSFAPDRRAVSTGAGACAPRALRSRRGADGVQCVCHSSGRWEFPRIRLVLSRIPRTLGASLPEKTGNSRIPTLDPVSEEVQSRKRAHPRWGGKACRILRGTTGRRSWCACRRRSCRSATTRCQWIAGRSGGVTRFLLRADPFGPVLRRWPPASTLRPDLAQRRAAVEFRLDAQEVAGRAQGLAGHLPPWRGEGNPAGPGFQFGVSRILAPRTQRNLRNREPLGCGRGARGFLAWPLLKGAREKPPRTSIAS